jgi:hypothetical protein
MISSTLSRDGADRELLVGAIALHLDFLMVRKSPK